MADLHAALHADKSAFTPPSSPPFSTITARKRRRDRRLAFTAAVALSSALALVSVAINFVSDASDRSAIYGADASGNGVTFALRPIGFQTDRAAEYEEAANACLDLPGVTGRPVTDTVPAFYSLSATGPDVEALKSCVTAIGADVEEVPGRPGQAHGQAEFVRRCVGAEQVSPDERYLGWTEEEVRTATQPVRVICRDRVYLDRTTDGHSERLNLVVENGKVVWAGHF